MIRLGKLAIQSRDTPCKWLIGCVYPIFTSSDHQTNHQKKHRVNWKNHVPLLKLKDAIFTLFQGFSLFPASTLGLAIDGCLPGVDHKKSWNEMAFSWEILISEMYIIVQILPRKKAKKWYKDRIFTNRTTHSIHFHPVFFPFPQRPKPSKDQRSISSCTHAFKALGITTLLASHFFLNLSGRSKSNFSG